jgi:hypothetical protein
MFEKAIPIPRDSHAAGSDSDLLIGSAVVAPGKVRGGGKALRAIEWGELTARLNAARDLRQLMQRDLRHGIDGVATSFGDAAARYFQALEEDERLVNPNALEARKGSGDMASGVQQDATNGDRE